MSDSFSDLWNSSAPAKPLPPKLGQSPSMGSPSLGSGPNFANGRPPPRDIFATLSTPSVTPSPGPSRTMTPSGGVSIARTSSAQSRGGIPLQGMENGRKANAGSGVDAFSGLGIGKMTTARANMTMAERAAQDQEQRRAQLQAQQAAQKHQEGAWAGIDALGGAGTLNPLATSKAPEPAHQDWTFDLAAPVSVTAPSKPPQMKTTYNEDDWGLSNAFSSPPQPASRTTPQPSAPSKPSESKSPNVWDFDTLSSPSREHLTSTRNHSPPHTSSPGDFDFGSREDRYDEDSAEEDLLSFGERSMRSRTTLKRASSSQSRHSPPSPQPPQQKPLRGSSPPPHVIGQIVEMGFTPQQARIALAATDSGLDVQAALETLLTNGAAGPEQPARTRDRYIDDDELSIPVRRRPLPGSRRTSGRDEPLPSSQTPNLQEQADRLLASATEIGAGLFSKANAFWSQGKERVQRVYEEHAAAGPANSSGAGTRQQEAPARVGRPRWMQEAVERDEGDWGVDSEQTTTRDKSQSQQNRRNPSNRLPRQAEQPRPSHPEVRTKDLFSDEEPTVYVSPFRRRPTGGAVLSPAPVTTPSTASRAPHISHAPLPPQLVEREVISASANAITMSNQHKNTGTEKFKLGQYADAESSYTHALEVLPDRHLLRLPLLTNRALARIRTGQHAGAFEDCSDALSLLGPSFHPSREKKVEDSAAGAGVDLLDGAIKARRRRAEAAEGREKWASARADWETLAGTDWVPARVRLDAVAGVSRCRKMEGVNAGSDAISSSHPPVGASGLTDPPHVKPRPKVSTAVRPKPVVQPSGEALARVQAANRAAEAEDDQKHALKDSVDSRLLAWQGGKETNLRALLASLDTVLWPELGMPKVGMHELVTPSQVKIKYTRAIARLHPDKLNVANTTLEQRMIANGVFGALNEAWIAFKP